MQFENGKESMEFGFEQHPIGTYAFQILEGVKKNVGDKDAGNHGVNISFFLQSIKAQEKNLPRGWTPGNPDAVGGKISFRIFVIKKDTGEKIKKAEEHMADLLTITDLIAKFRKQFPKGVELDDDKFINQLAISLPGKYIRGLVTMGKDQNDDPQANLKKCDRYGKKGIAPEPVAEEPETAGEDPGDGEDDWG